MTTQIDELLKLFRESKNAVTRGAMVHARRRIGVNATARVSDLRARLEREGKTIRCFENHKSPEKNLYKIVKCGK